MQEFRVSEVLEARSIIGHDIFHPIDEGDLGAVTMVALMEAGDLAEVGGWSAGSGAAFEVASQSGSVVHQVRNSRPSSVIGVEVLSSLTIIEKLPSACSSPTSLDRS